MLTSDADGVGVADADAATSTTTADRKPDSNGIVIPSGRQKYGNFGSLMVRISQNVAFTNIRF